MRAERLHQVSPIFRQAVEVPPDERAAFLDAACGGDAALRRDAERLISAHERAGSFIEAPAYERAAGMLVDRPAKLVVGQLVGLYIIVAQLGRGGMGEVYLAQDTKLDRKVALKLLPEELATDAERMRRFVQEAKAASALNHPNIITIYELGETVNTHFIASEYIAGETLHSRLRNDPMSLKLVLDVAIQIGSALQAAHEAKIVHRDIKPENVMIRPDGLVKILDFGIAKLSEPAAAVGADAEAATAIKAGTSPGMIIGTVAYMSPEQARGKGVDARTDIFSLGVVLYEMLTGKRPFEGETAMDVIGLILHKEPLPIRQLMPDVPPEIERIINKTLRKDCDERYQTVKDLLIDLKDVRRELEFQDKLERTAAPHRETAKTEILDATTVAAAQTTSSAEYIVGEIKKRKLGVVAVLAVLLLAPILYLVFIHRSSSLTNSAPIDSIAVLPFQNKNSDADTEYLSDGLAESLIYRLSQLPNLKVSPTSSVMRYKGKEADVQKIGQELGVNAVLSGRIVQRGDNLTVSVELVDVRYNRLLWGEQYDRKMSELLATQGEIAQEITEKLRVKVAGEEQKGITKRYTESNEAYQLYLKGRFYWNKRTGEALKKSIEYFNQAIEKDPHFALAYAGLADCYVVPANPLPPREKIPKAKAEAMRALELDDTLTEAHTTLARALMIYDWDWTGAEKEFKRAIALNADYAIAHQWYSGYLEAMGRRNEAITEAKRAQELDPLAPIMNFEVGMAFYYNRDYDKAIEQLQKTLELDPDFPPAHGQLPAAYELKGMYDQAIAGFQKGLARRGTNEWYFSIAGLGHVYAVSGKTGEARVVLNELKQLSGREYVPADRIALIYAGLGEKDQAFAWLEKAYGERSFNMAWLKVEPRWDSLRDDPRFADLARRIGLP